MQPVPFALVADLLEDPVNGWSIGSFGAVGEFVRDGDEPVSIRRSNSRIEVETARGAIRVEDASLAGVAWDSLSGDGETWGHALALCVTRPATGERVIRALGADHAAIRSADADERLYDLGVGSGCVVMAARTNDPALVAALDAAVGQSLFDVAGIMPLVLAAQPHRVLLSPAGRIEVYQPIPPADGKSPIGPHTHLLPKLIAKDRGHSANVPIPDGWQAALSMHPPSPWRSRLGERQPFDPTVDADFAPLLARFGLPSDHAVDAIVDAALTAGEMCWPEARRDRHRARIALRRKAAAGDVRAAPWRVRYDHATLESEESDEDR